MWHSGEEPRRDAYPFFVGFLLHCLLRILSASWSYMVGLDFVVSSFGFVIEEAR